MALVFSRPHFPSPLAAEGQRRHRLSLQAAAAIVFAFAFVCLLAGSLAHAAEPTYPALTGRVVDNAAVLSADSRQRLDAKLADLEQKSGIQLVVATVPNLDGQEIEPYANGLFRSWQLGEAKANNGVLVLVAPKEHRVRIEVGYGEEGTLTDAMSKVIITNAMVPRFKTGDFQGGIERGVDDIITVLTTDSSEWQKRPNLREDSAAPDTTGTVLFLIVFAIVILIMWRSARRGGRAGGSGPWIYPPMGGGWGGSGGFGGGGFSGGGSSGGGFSGGGGSSGGGGASGGW